MEHYYAMIMAGGGGTRLWPKSRGNTPKQLLPLVEDQSMFRVSVERLAPLFPPENIYIVTGRRYIDALRADAPEIPPENFIAEPSARNSGPAAALGLTVIRQRDPDAVVAILTADHHIAYKDRFRSVLHAAYDVARQGKIVTLGISPSFPSTGFGYIRRGEVLGDFGGFEAYESRGFAEKPNLETAVQFLQSGDYSWNSGMFIWQAAQGLDEFRRQQPEMAAQFDALGAHVGSSGFDAALDAMWAQVTNISLDYAVMEGAQNMAVIPVDIGWSDVGAWDALFGVLECDTDGNCHKGHSDPPIMIDTKNTLVYADKLTVTIGVENLIVVDADDVLMICHRDHAQDVKKVVDHLRKAESHHLL
jgi:mannose-1-phosphate guanylyltransferase